MKDFFRDLINEITGSANQSQVRQNKKVVKYDEAVTTETKEIYDTYGGEVKRVLDADQEKCSACGAPLIFDPATQKLKCEHCNSFYDINKDESAEIELDFLLDNHKKWKDETRVFSCDSCGAEIVFDKDEFSTICPFCSSPSVTLLEYIDGIRPNAVVPFEIAPAQARERYAAWVKKHIFAPNQFRRTHQVESFHGFYSPSWTYDTHTFSTYTGVVGDYYYVTVGSGKNRRTERRIRYRNVSGSHSSFFDDININSGKKLDDYYFKKLQPFPTGKSAKYSRKFLSGYSAEHYSKPLSAGWTEALRIINEKIRTQIRNSLHCDVVQSLNIYTQYNDKTFKYVLLPIYVVSHMFKKKNFLTFINGATGKVAGKAPVSAIKLIAFIFGLLAGVALGIIGYLLYTGGLNL